MNEYGSHPLQVLIEKASSKEEVRLIINYLTKCKDFVALCKSQQGSFVIQKITISLIKCLINSSKNILLS